MTCLRQQSRGEQLLTLVVQIRCATEAARALRPLAARGPEAGQPGGRGPDPARWARRQLSQD